MDLIPIRNSLFHDVRMNEIIDKIYSRLIELKLIDRKYVTDTEFILYLMNIIENLVTKKDNINKKELLIKILKNHYSASESELVVVDKMIQFLHTNKQVKKVSYYKLFKTTIKEIFFKKSKE